MINGINELLDKMDLEKRKSLDILDNLVHEGLDNKILVKVNYFGFNKVQLTNEQGVVVKAYMVNNDRKKQLEMFEFIFRCDFEPFKEQWAPYYFHKNIKKSSEFYPMSIDLLKFDKKNVLMDSFFVGKVLGGFVTDFSLEDVDDINNLGGFIIEKIKRKLLNNNVDFLDNETKQIKISEFSIDTLKTEFNKDLNRYLESNIECKTKIFKQFLDCKLNTEKNEINENTKKKKI